MIDSIAAQLRTPGRTRGADGDAWEGPWQGTLMRAPAGHSWGQVGDLHPIFTAAERLRRRRGANKKRKSGEKKRRGPAQPPPKAA